MNSNAPSSSASAHGTLAAVILAAGKGTRMKSDLPKVVHEVGGRPMVCAVVDACLAAGCSRVVVVVGYKQELVRAALASYGTGPSGQARVEYVVQEEQLGTGHAVMCAASAFTSQSQQAGHTTFVLAGDGPLIRPATLKTMLDRHRGSRAAATMATSVIDDPAGYGRIKRSAQGQFLAIVEQKNATPDELKIREVNPSYYCFDVQALFAALKNVKRNPVGNEYYITDVPELLLKEGQRVEVIDAVPPEDILSINTLEELAKVDAIYRGRHNTGHNARTTSGAAT